MLLLPVAALSLLPPSHESVDLCGGHQCEGLKTKFLFLLVVVVILLRNLFLDKQGWLRHILEMKDALQASR